MAYAPRIVLYEKSIANQTVDVSWEDSDLGPEPIKARVRELLGGEWDGAANVKTNGTPVAMFSRGVRMVEVWKDRKRFVLTQGVVNGFTYRKKGG